MLPCLDCGSSTCTQHPGSIVITECPLKMIDGKTDEVIRYARYVRDSGIWPVAGGALDQSAAFVAATSQIRNDHEAWKRDLTSDI